MDKETNIQMLKDQIQAFCEERDWDPFHGAKDLAIGAVTESSELLEHFRFQTEEQIEQIMKDPEKKKEICHEVADVFFFLLRFCQKYDISLSQSFMEKMERNAKRYPASEFRGKNHKAKS